MNYYTATLQAIRYHDYMKRRSIIFLLCLWVGVSHAQVTLDSCRHWAQQNYPAIRQYALIQQSTEYTLSNAARAWIPRVVLSAQATYQSDAANMSDVWQAMGLGDMLSNMGKDIPDMYMRPFQGKVQVDVQQNIWDGGMAAANKQAAQCEQQQQTAKIDVELHQLDNRILSLYFGILLLQEQSQQLAGTDSLLRSNLARVQTMYNNHIVLSSDVDALTVEVLELQQKREQLQYSLRAYREMLSMMVGRNLSQTELVLPQAQELSLKETNIRPELQLLTYQSDHIASQRKKILSYSMPQFSAFAQGWYGYPTLNMFEAMQSSRWGLSGIVGVRMQWNIGAYYTQKNTLRQLDLRQEQIQVQEDVFLYNQRMQRMQENAEIVRLQQALQSDEQIVGLRGSVRQAAETKYENGTITISELLQTITNEDAAKSARAIHQIELIKATYELQNL